MKDPNAKMLNEISYADVLRDGLKIIDPAAISLCKDNGIKVIVLNIFKDGNITKALRGEKIGTLIS